MPSDPWRISSWKIQAEQGSGLVVQNVQGHLLVEDLWIEVNDPGRGTGVTILRSDNVVIRNVEVHGEGAALFVKDAGVRVDGLQAHALEPFSCVEMVRAEVTLRNVDLHGGCGAHSLDTRDAVLEIENLTAASWGTALSLTTTSVTAEDLGLSWIPLPESVEGSPDNLGMIGVHLDLREARSASFKDLTVEGFSDCVDIREVPGDSLIQVEGLRADCGDRPGDAGLTVSRRSNQAPGTLQLTDAVIRDSWAGLTLGHTPVELEDVLLEDVGEPVRFVEPRNASGEDPCLVTARNVTVRSADGDLETAWEGNTGDRSFCDWFSQGSFLGSLETPIPGPWLVTLSLIGAAGAWNGRRGE